MAAEITVVCSTYRRHQRLAAFVSALEAQDLGRDRFEVIIVDNGSHDETGATLARLAASSPITIKTLEIQDNHGPAAARNLGWRSATTPYIAFTDDDCDPKPSWLRSGLECIDADQTLGVVQGTTEPGGDIGVHTLVREVRAPGSPFFEGCNIFYRRDALQAAGGFDENLGWYGEDTTIGWAVLDKGWRRGFAEDAVVVHPIEERPMRWHIQSAWLEGNFVGIAKRFPGFADDAFDRSWRMRPQDLRTILAVGAVVVSVRKPWALVLTYPWYRMRKAPKGHDRPIGLLAERAVLDVASVAGLALASVRERHLVI